MSFKLDQRSCILILSFITFIVFFPSLHNQFTNWDDQVLLTQNPIVWQLNFENLRKIFDLQFISYYPPLTLFSFAIEHHFVKLQPFMYHLDNLILHTLNVVLVFILINRLSKDVLISFLTALLFAINPLRVESVAWVAQRKDVLFTFFYLLSLICYLRKAPVSCFVFFILSCLAKIQGLTLPFALLILDYYQKQQGGWVVVLRKWPHFLVGLVFSMLLIKGQWPQFAAIHRFDIGEKIFLACHAFILYSFKSIFPYQLCALYPFPELHNSYAWPIYASALVTFFWLIAIIKNYAKHPVFVAGSLFFGINIMLALSSIISVGVFINDRFTYLPSIGLYWMLASVTGKVLGSRWRSVGIALLIVYILILGFLSFNRSKIWFNGISLWSDVISQYPKLAFAYDNRGNSYVQENRNKEAFDDFSKAIALNDHFASAYVNRAILFAKNAQAQEALNDFNKAIESDPNYANAYFNRGIFYLQKSDQLKAKEDFLKAKELGMDIPKSLYFSGT